jgi:hypothetical protein
MTLAAESGPGVWFPELISPILSYNTGLMFRTGHTLDAAAEKCLMYGSIFIDGRAASKTISSAGGKIHFLPGAVTFANAGTTIRVGLQDLSTSAGPGTQPDASFDVYGDLVGATDTITTNTWKTVTMSSGTKTLSNSDLVGIVLDMTGRGGADSVIIRALEGASLSTSPSHFPGENTFVAAWSATTVSGTPIALIEFDDGTLGVIEGTWPLSNMTSHAYVNADNPDEKGLLFQFPTERKVDAYHGMLYMANSAADFTIQIYSDPLGTPAAVSGSTLTHLGEHGSGVNALRFWRRNLASEITLAANTLYCLAIKADSTGAVGFQSLDIANEDYRKFFTGGTNLRMGHRNNGSGAFTETTTQIPFLGMRCTSFHDGSGGSTTGYIRPVGAGGLVG